MDVHVLNIDLFKKLSLAIAIIRNTPFGIKPDVFTRCLAKRLYPQSNQYDEYLIHRQQDLLSRFQPIHSTITSSISFMDLTTSTNISIPSTTNEYEYDEFAEKVYKLKDKKRLLKIEHIDSLLNLIIKWIKNNSNDRHILPIDACLYTIQLIANHLKTDNDKPYHIILDLLPIIDKYLDSIFDILEHTMEKNVYYLHQMIISFASSNSCISRVMDKLCFRLQQYSEIPDDHDSEFLSTISLIDPIDRLFNILHEIIHNRSLFQRRLSQRSIDKLYHFIHQISPLLDGKSNHYHLLKLQGQLQAANYKQSNTLIKTFPSYTSSSSSGDHSSQYQQQQQKYSTTKPPSKMNSLDYSMSQQSQSQYF